ncbi:DUF1574 family protein [Sulfurimonas sp.]|uniref:DUF1574 family protein n=1 Tax=Sulfurimonas sp. TaxID=2022749 RepID=UPI001A068A19|nr:DUF1574 family protein [Sulfurimonas sp.]MBE0514928.1 DUF1574 family protein [Sulfurimonas sp.]
MNYKKFNKITLLSILAAFFATILFNFIIDPYHVFNTPKFEKINAIKNHTINHGMSKFYTAKLANPTVLLIGTSRTAHMHPKYLQKYFSNEKIYNLAVPGSGIASQRNNIEYFIKHHKIKAIVYGVDFFAFNPTNNTPNSKEEGRYTDDFTKDYMDSLLSIRTLRKSIKTLGDNIKGKYQHLDYAIGWDTYENDYLHIEKDGIPYIEAKTSKELQMLSTQNKHFNYAPFKEASSIEKPLEDIEKIVQLCKENDIALHMFISPIYSEIVDLIYSREYGKSYHHWKNELAKYGSVYDFSGYNSITTDVSNYIDGSHYQTKLAPLMFAKMFHDKSVDVPNDFGTILTVQNIDKMLTTQEEIARQK